MRIQNNEKSISSCYRISISGRLDNHWSEWFNGYVEAIEAPESMPNMTVLIVKVPDQAALRGILNRIWDLNLSIMALVKV